MLVKAKWNVKDAGGWHRPGDVFQTDGDLGEAVEVLDAPEQPSGAPEKTPEAETVPERTEAAEPKKPARRRKVSK